MIQRAADMASAPLSLWDNPLGTDGFEFVEYAAPDPAALGRLFEQLEAVGAERAVPKGSVGAAHGASSAKSQCGTIFTPASFSCDSISDPTYVSPKPSRLAVTRV